MIQAGHSGMFYFQGKNFATAAPDGAQVVGLSLRTPVFEQMGVG